MGGTCSTYEGEERDIQGFGGETWGKETLRKPRHRWEENFKMELQEVGWVGMNWIALTQDRDSWQVLVNAVMDFRVT